MTDTISRENFMTNTQGHLVPINMVADVDQARDHLVREIVSAARNLQESMRNFKIWAMGDIYAFVDLSAEKYDAKIGGVKGNLSLVSFDGSLRVQVAVCEHLSFDERLQAAKALVYECLTDWTVESRDEIKAIVMNAFQVNKGSKSYIRVYERSGPDRQWSAIALDMAADIGV